MLVNSLYIVAFPFLLMLRITFVKKQKVVFLITAPKSILLKQNTSKYISNGPHSAASRRTSQTTFISKHFTLEETQNPDPRDGGIPFPALCFPSALLRI
mmetsp:Transcript_37384/g.54702  ORF Transcript_37384/g.54702 Transcript_37384/m.54702 type:complete len:99 (+) Transcript_37384:42-338(+)